ncbi:MAG: iron complex outermembrane recepter [Gallionellaceae bacterium]|nr:MAG: iron complex outermembrane recepter [Gallionellaceae bacterium]
MQSYNLKLKPVAVLLASLFATGAFAQDGNVVQTESVSVFGQGQSRQVQTINSADMKKAAAGTSPLKVLEKLPGVSFQSSDPFGAYEWSTRFGVRGFSQSYMGFTLDGIPLGDMSYGNNNGLHISRAIASENVGRVSLSQGAGSLGVASTSNLGGTVQFVSSEPENKLGVRVDQTMGSSSMSRTFARLDTGLLESGTKAYMSYVNQGAQKWKGWGPQNQEQFNSKLVHMWGENKITAFLNTSDRSETDYQDMSIDMQQKLGWGWDNYAPDWKRAIDAARGTYSGGVGNINANTGPLDAAYYLGRGLRKDRLFGTSLDVAVTEDVRLKSTFYTHSNKGQGQWYTPYVASPGTAAAAGVYTGEGLPISIRTTEYTIDRSGWVNDLTWNAGINTVNAGLWMEKSYSTLARNYFAATGPTDTNYFLTNPFKTDFVQDFATTTTQFHLQDTVALMDGQMKTNFGFKSPKVQIDATSQAGTRSGGSLAAEKAFLPQLGVNFSLNDMNEVFASASQNMRAYQPGVNGPFSQTQAAFNASKASLKPEMSETYEAGYRYKGDSLQGSLAAYLTNFHDRLLQVTSTVGIVSIPGTFVNVGSVQSKGVEAALVWTPVQDWTWFNSLTLNDSQYKSDYVNGGTTVNTSGKQVVDAPKVMFNTDIGYENNGWFGNLGGKYTGERYYTYLNNGKVDSYFVMNAAAGYKQANMAGLKEFSAQVAITNLLDKKYFSTIGSNGFVASDANGAFATMQEGAPRQLFLTLSGKF